MGSIPNRFVDAVHVVSASVPLSLPLCTISAVAALPVTRMYVRVHDVYTYMHTIRVVFVQHSVPLCARSRAPPQGGVVPLQS